MYKDKNDKNDPPIAFFDFIKYRRDSRGKMAIKNEDLFILWCQHALLSWVLIILFALVNIFRLGDSKTLMAKLLVKVYTGCITAFFIKFLLVGFTEVGSHDIFIP
jgi:hypothetical protein